MYSKVVLVVAILASVNAAELGLGSYATHGVLLTKVVPAPVAPTKAAAVAEPETHTKPTSYSSIVHYITPVVQEAKAPAQPMPVTKIAAKEETFHYSSPVVHVVPEAKVQAQPMPVTKVVPKEETFHYSSPVVHVVPEAKPMPVSTKMVAETKVPITQAPKSEEHKEQAAQAPKYADAHPQYAFEYGVKDTHTHDIKKQHEERDGDLVKGYYVLHQPDGRIRKVHYNADHHNGFNANVEYEGHAIHPVAVEEKEKTPEKH